MSGAIVSFRAAQRIVERAYDDLSNPRTLAEVRRDYELIRKAASGAHLTSARDHVARRLKQADATNGGAE